MEVLTTAEMEHADRLTIAAGTPGFALMISAGQAVAQAAMDLGSGARSWWLPAAATMAATVLWRRPNWRRAAARSRSSCCASGTVCRAMRRCGARLERPGAAVQSAGIGKPALIIDALFGAGLNRPVKGDPHDMIEAINASGAPVLSVDLPSGDQRHHGRRHGRGGHAPRDRDLLPPQAGASAAAGTAALRPRPSRRYRHRCRVLGEIRPQTFENVPDAWQESFPVPRIDGHKYARGHAVVVSGDMASTGAARLAARGALRAGAGLVTLASPRDALAVNAAALTAVMVRAIDTVGRIRRPAARQAAQCLRDRAGRRRRPAHPRSRSDGVVGETSSRARCRRADEFADAPDRLFESIKASDDQQVVLTPHEGEFPRLFSDMSNKHPNRSKLERVRVAAERGGAVVLLKGPDTVVASPDGRATIAANAPPWLATAGAGDVLAGIIAGLLAQGVPAFEAACIGVWMHGEAAREAGPGLIAEDLTEVLPAVFRRLYDEFGIEY